MQWLEVFLLMEASAGLLLASLNCRRLLAYAAAAHSAARRTGAYALALISGALALEALTFLAWPAIEASPGLRDAGLLTLRTALLAGSAALSVLLLRAGRRRVQGDSHDAAGGRS